ncbi:cytochrome P450, partial [Apodospora peruviana]
MLARLILVALPLVAVYLFTKFRYKRFKQFSHIPQLKSSFIWGHLKVLHEYISRGPPGCHIDDVLGVMADDLGNPAVVLVDLRPVSSPMAIITSHYVAEQISRPTKQQPWSTPKSPTLGVYHKLIGPQSILLKEGEDWKRMRKRFNPGFARQHLMTLLPVIMDKTATFLKHLDSYAATGEDLELMELTINLTFDIIGAVVMDVDFDAQHHDGQGSFIRLYSELMNSYPGESGRTPWWLQPMSTWNRRQVANRVDNVLKQMIRQKFAESRQQEAGKKSRSVLNLALQGTETLTDELLDETCDQVKTFLFAGHDTTSILLTWIVYEMSRTPRIAKAIRAELDDIFGPDTDPTAVRDKLLSPQGDDMLRRMSYTSAVVKEALRLHPPAGSARMTDPGTHLTVTTPQGEEICLDGMVIYLCHTIIQKDRAVYGDSPNDFVPERWLGDTDTSENGTNVDMPDSTHEKDSGRSKIPVSAWRPFERGPRSCIGQELANIEARVILAMIGRRYDFVKVGLGELYHDEKGQPVLNEKGKYKVKSEIYS